jgi:hypothetical protein
MDNQESIEILQSIDVLQDEDHESLSDENLNEILNFIVDSNDELSKNQPKLGIIKANVLEGTPKGYLRLVRRGEFYLVRKSTMLWMLEEGHSRVSSDRLKRFVSEQKSLENVLVPGDFIRIENEGKESVCQVIKFRFKTGRQNFTAKFCPLEAPSENARGVDVLVKFYDQKGDKIEACKKVHRFVDIKCYKQHLKVIRDLSLNTLKIGH